jgi:GNAT superfamily N-acetyltransferase
MSITTAKATRADMPAVHGLVRELAVYERAEPELIATVADYERDFEAGIFEVLLAKEREEVVGMALYHFAYSTWKGRMMYLEDFVITEARRGEGIGQVLFDAFLEEARHSGCRLVKWQVLDWNEPALRFYEKYAAAIEKDWWNGKLFLERQ